MKLFLLGDSIRMGYEPMVIKKLSGIADVYAPQGNCQFAQFTFCHLHNWAEQTGCANEIDLVHWNNGIWDTVRRFGDSCLTPVNVYIDYLRRTHKRINILFPKAKIIFALSTPVQDHKYNEQVFWIRNDDIKQYNEQAVRLMEELKIPVNDLFAVAKNFTEEHYLDSTHFNEKGSDLLADQVVKTCKNFFDTKE